LRSLRSRKKFAELDARKEPGGGEARRRKKEKKGKRRVLVAVR